MYVFKPLQMSTSSSDAVSANTTLPLPGNVTMLVLRDTHTHLQLAYHVCDNLTDHSPVDLRLTCVLDLYLPPVVFAIGIVCNVLVIVVMRSKHFRKLSTSFYMAVNAFTDGVSILVALPVHFLYVNFPDIFEHVRHRDSICAFFNILGWGTSDFGILLVVAMTTERAIAIRYPLHAYKMCTTKRARYVVVGLFFFELAKLFHFAFKSRVVDETVTTHLCDVYLDDNTTYSYFYIHVWPWLHAFVLGVSYCLVIGGNIIIVLHIRQSGKGHSTDGIGRKNSRNDSQINTKNRQLSIMLVVDSCFLVACTLPYAVIVILIFKFNMLQSSSEGGKNLAFTASFYLLYVNRCLNFFLYCVSGARFRSALCDVVFSESSSKPATPFSRFLRHTIRRRVRVDPSRNTHYTNRGTSGSLSASVNTTVETRVQSRHDLQVRKTSSRVGFGNHGDIQVECNREIAEGNVSEVNGGAGGVQNQGFVANLPRIIVEDSADYKNIHTPPSSTSVTNDNDRVGIFTLHSSVKEKHEAVCFDLESKPSVPRDAYNTVGDRRKITFDIIKTQTTLDYDIDKGKVNDTLESGACHRHKFKYKKPNLGETVEFEELSVSGYVTYL